MKINNKGFATSIILFSLLVLFLIIISTLFVTMNNSITLNTILKRNIEDKLEDDFSNTNTKYIYEFDFTSYEQEFIVPYDGTYKLETWGAQGGSVNEIEGGYGGYSTGNIKLNKGETLYINVGGSGTIGYVGTYTVEGGYNGGGSNTGGSYGRGASGGGATHISLKSGLLNTLSEDIDKILIVSGGGGGAGVETENNSLRYFIPGNGGGYSGTSGEIVNYTEGVSQPGNQTTGFAFGQGESSTSWAGAGGGGFYGGYATSSGAGGSGYISNSGLTDNVMYCYNCAESTDEDTKTISTTNVSSIPTSNYAKIGNGYAKITYLGE